MPDLLAELEWRGFVHHATKQLQQHLEQPRTVYCGFDPTAPSLQIGNLVPILLLRHFQRAGHLPIALMGGGTGLIGDPSGKPGERPLLTKEQAREHVHRQRDQMARFLDFDPGPSQALVLNNADWLVEQRLVDFLRDIGKHFTVNIMLQKESVQARLEAGISYTEFSYMLLQAYDFLHLSRTKQCTIQVGGSDQWGNITAGIDLIRRVEGKDAHGLVAPLVTTASGAKFGKSEQGALWLDPALTSPYRFYQYWINVDDRDVERYLKLFTFLPKDGPQGVSSLLKMHAKDPSQREAQSVLAQDITTLVHGKDAAYNATGVSAILFGDFDPHRVNAGVFAEMAREIPTVMVSVDGVALVDALVQAGLVKSKSEARRQIEQGGVYVNQERVKGVERGLTATDWLAGGHLLLRKGKKEYALLRRQS